MTSQLHPSHSALIDHVSRTRLAKSCETRDDSLSWNLSRVNEAGWSNPSRRHGFTGTKACAERVNVRVAVRRQEQLGVSSSEEQKTFYKASRWGYSRAATGRGAGRARCRLVHEHGREQNGSTNNSRLHQTCRPVNQFEHVCVERCPLTMRHAAKRSGDSCGNER